MTILAALLTSAGFLLSPGFIAAAERSNIAPTDLARGRWALLFVVVPGRPACEDAIRWLGQVRHCKEVCVWWHQDVDPMCVNMCEFPWWWCPPCIHSCIAGCPIVWMCLQTSVVCSCVSAIPYGFEPVAY